MTVRPAGPGDAAACLAIYAPYVEGSHVSFEERAPSEEEMRERIVRYASTHAWLAAVENGSVVGYAYGCPHRARPAYRWSAEVAIYVAPAARGKGVAKALYAALFARLKERGYHSLFAGVTLPNDASVALHKAAGFSPVGVFRRVGFKDGAWRDTSWWQLQLSSGEEPPRELTRET